jgi:hypothetical protein
VTTSCIGVIGWHPLSAYTAIISNYGTPEVKNECIFVTKSKVGRKILKVCHKDLLCRVEAVIENTSGEYEIMNVISVEGRSYD